LSKVLEEIDRRFQQRQKAARRFFLLFGLDRFPYDYRSISQDYPAQFVFVLQVKELKDAPWDRGPMAISSGCYA
jgi:hypothetical protein